MAQNEKLKLLRAVAARKPRPASYQVFTTRKLGSRGYFNDYVFYNVQGRVIYVARRDAA